MLIMRALHIVAAIWLVSGLLARWMAYGQARRAGDIQSASALLGLSDRYERLMVIPGSQAVIVLGLLTAWLQGQPLLGALQGARSNWLFVSLVLSLAIIPIVAFVLIPRRRQRLASLAAAVAQRAMTPELRAALDDHVVVRARTAEALIVAAVFALMVLKPF
jgi:hypothetical protein